MSIPARYSGVCPKCGDRWQPGDLIRSDFEVPGRYPIWTHAVCPEYWCDGHATHIPTSAERTHHA